MHLGRWTRHGNPLVVTQIHGNPAANFWHQVYQDGPVLAAYSGLGSCWIWAGYRDHAGYGQIQWNGKKRGSHVAAWFLAHGVWPDGLCVLHRCDNPSCVRAEHLFLGTHQDNVADKVSKGRQLKGQKNATAKLTEQNVQEIRATYVRGIVGYERLAKRYGVDPKAIRQVLDGTTWRHVV
jgi:hypothetical protein